MPYVATLDSLHDTKNLYSECQSQVLAAEPVACEGRLMVLKLVVMAISLTSGHCLLTCSARAVTATACFRAFSEVVVTDVTSVLTCPFSFAACLLACFIDCSRRLCQCSKGGWGIANSLSLYSFAAVTDALLPLLLPFASLDF